MAQSSPERVRELYEQEKPSKAYEWGSAHLGEYAGTPVFDFYYGLAALETGKVGEAAFAFERVLSRDPGFDRARLELARSYFLLKEDQRAREEFRTVLSHDPPKNVRAVVERYLAAIRRRADAYNTVVTGEAALSAGYDTNVSSSTDANNVPVLLFLGGGKQQGQLNLDNQSERGDSFLAAEGSLRISRPLAPDLKAFAGLTARRRLNRDETDFNTGKLRGEGGVELRFGPTRIRPSLGVTRIFLGSSPYQDQLDLSSSIAHSLNQQTTLTGFMQLARLDYRDQPLRDADKWLIGGGVGRQFQGVWRPYLNVQGYGGQAYARKDSKRAEGLSERAIVGGTARLRLAPARQWRPSLMLRIHHEDYAEPVRLANNPIVVRFDQARQETLYQIEAKLDWQPDPHWRVGPRVRFSRKDANIDLYEYDRTQAWLEARYQFF